MLSDILAGLEIETVLAAPLMVGRRPLGVLAVGRSARRPGFAETDIAVIEELSRRVGVGLANADSSARDRSVAETLQRSVLPDALPSIAGLDLAVRYIPGTDDIDVGGDWYDAFPLGDGQVGLVIGDVVGHSIASASIMGQVRNLLRAYAIDRPDPADVLARTKRALSRLLPEALATAVYAVLDLASGDLRYANAGHPPPVCAIGADRIEYLDDAIGTMLGAVSGGAFTVGYRRLAAGARVLFYTDGLIERRRQDIAEGSARSPTRCARPTGSARSGPAPPSSASSSATAPARTTSACWPPGSPAYDAGAQTSAAGGRAVRGRAGAWDQRGRTVRRRAPMYRKGYIHATKRKKQQEERRQSRHRVEQRLG